MWMNGISGKLYEMFKFEGGKEKVQQIGEDLAGAFNELVAGKRKSKSWFKSISVGIVFSGWP